jgi:RHS repeat-associated protein
VKYPGGLTRTDTLDASFAPVARVYKRDSDGAVVYSESIVENTQGQWVNHTYTGGSKTYGYDTLGRLTSVQHTALGACATRTYAYDTRTNRTLRRTYNPGTGGACRSDTADAEDGHTYDTADRLTDTGYGYDSFGRITSLPSGLTNTYYANDLVASQETADTRQNWTLDPAHRFRAFTTANFVNGSWSNATSKLNHYGDDSDDPRWIVEDTSLGSITRNVSGPDSDLVATTSATEDVRLQLTNLHGDVAATIDTTLSAPEFTSFDEFGVPGEGQAHQRYGWLGGKQRSADALGGVILMGVRLYSPALGRFLQVDPVPGGNSTAYDYCSADPVNCSDLDGKWGWSSFKKALNVVATVASYASMIPGPIGTIAGVVSAVAYVATGNWQEAAWAIGGAAAAMVGAGAAVKAAKIAVTAVRASSKAAKFGSWAAKAGRAVKAVVTRGCNSFAPDTPVLMADGSYLPISEVEIGDQVTAVDPTTGQRSVRPVLAVFVGQGDKHLVDIDLDGDDSDVLTATAEHPIWVDGRGWTFAVNVRAGNWVQTSNGELAQVRRVTDRGTVHGATVFNLNVGDTHTYVVSVDGTDLVVHNSSCSVLPGKFARAPRSRGVYVISYSNGEHYIGKAKNIHRRMHQHYNSGKLNGAVGVRFISRPRGSLKQLEQGTINRYKCYGGAILRNKIRASRKYAHC